MGACLNDYDVTPTYSPTGILVRKDLEARAPALVDHVQFLTLFEVLRAYSRGELSSQLEDRVAEQRAAATAPPVASGVKERLARLTRDQHPRFYRAPVPKYWDRLRGAYADLKRIAEATGFRLLVAIFPEGYQIADADADMTPQRRLLAVCAEVGLTCLDLAPAFRVAGGQLFTDTQHPNARGFAVAADDIATALGTTR